jgi:hypothetical protein
MILESFIPARVVDRAGDADAGKIVDMQPLHDKHDRTLGRIIEARHQGCANPFCALVRAVSE